MQRGHNLVSKLLKMQHLNKDDEELAYRLVIVLDIRVSLSKLLFVLNRIRLCDAKGHHIVSYL